MRKFLCCALIVLGWTASQAQTQIGCSQTLRLARSTYESGRLHELPGLLKECLESGFNQQEKIDAYKLLTLAYIFLEEPDKADETMLKLLQTDHYFVLNESIEPAEFVALYNTFRTDPIYRIGLKAGSNATQPNVLSFNPVNEGEYSYSYAFGFNAQLSAEIPNFFKKNLTLNPGLGFSIKSFKYDGRTLNVSGDATSETIGKETQQWVTLPLTIQYALSKDKGSKFNPYIGLGTSIDYLLSSTVNVEQKRPGNQSIEARNFEVNPLRNKLNVSLMATAGAKVEVKGGYITAEIGYQYGLLKINDRASLLGNQFLISDYQYVDGVYALSSISISVGYAYNIFNPVKLK